MNNLKYLIAAGLIFNCAHAADPFEEACGLEARIANVRVSKMPPAQKKELLISHTCLLSSGKKILNGEVTEGTKTLVEGLAAANNIQSTPLEMTTIENALQGGSTPNNFEKLASELHSEYMPDEGLTFSENIKKLSWQKADEVQKVKDLFKDGQTHWNNFSSNSTDTTLENLAQKATEVYEAERKAQYSQVCQDIYTKIAKHIMQRLQSSLPDLDQEAWDEIIALIATV